MFSSSSSYFVIVVLLLAVALSTYAASASKKAPQAHGQGHVDPHESYLEGRIVGGAKARENQFPYLIAIKHGKSSIISCGGSLIKDSLVLTAGHCIVNADSGKVEDRTLLNMLTAGEHAPRGHKGIYEQQAGIKRVVVHKDYGHETLMNDIALVELDKPFTLSKGVKTIKLADAGSKYRESNCTASGWGDTKKQTEDDQAMIDPKNLPNSLLFVQLDMINKEQCKSLYKGNEDWYVLAAHPATVCAGKLAGGKDVCNGDSGGPLACVSESSGEPLLVGLVSGGAGCGQENTPGVYTSTAFMQPWLEKAYKALADGGQTSKVLRV